MRAALDRWLTHLRTAVFLLGVAAVTLVTLSGARRSAVVCAAIFVVGFTALVAAHDHAWRTLATARQRRGMCRQGIARRRRYWAELPRDDISVPREHAALANECGLLAG